RRLQHERNPFKRAYLHSQAHKLAGLERVICPLFHVNTAVSELDAQVLQKASPEAHFDVVPNGTDTDYFVPGAAQVEPNTLIFASSLNWYPNISAVQFFVREVWPRVKRQCPGVRFYVAGQGVSGKLAQWLKRDPHI